MFFLRAKPFLLAVFLLCSCLSLHGQAPAELPNSLLWSVTGKGLKSPSYIFGTIHLVCDDYTLPDKVIRAIGSSERLYLEMDISDPTLAAKLMLQLKMKDTTLEMLVEKHTFDSLDQFFKDTIGIDINSFTHYSPFLLSSFAMTKQLNCGVGAVDEKVMKAAAKANLAVRGLETLDEQLAYINKTGYKHQADMLLDMMRDWQKTKEETHQLVSSYQEENLNEIDEIMAEAREEDPLFINYLLDERNNNWLSILTKSVKQKPTFVAVGSGHLTGYQGLIQKLRMEGYQVEPVFDTK